MSNRQKKLRRLIWIAPAALAGIAVFAWIGGEAVMLLWNWLAPALFGFHQVTFWQALGLLALCRILFGGFGLSGGNARSNSRRRMAERCEQMSPDEREKFRQWVDGRWGRTSPLDADPNA